MRRYTVFFSTDERYFAHCTTAIKSLLENNPKLSFDIHVINAGIDPINWQKLEETVKPYPQVNVVNQVIDAAIVAKLRITDHFQASNYFRLFVEHLAEEDKVLYLDADLLVLGEVESLFEIDLEGMYVAAVENPGFGRHAKLKMKSTSGYFNSGVMLINVAMWRKHQIFNRVVEFVKENPKVIQYVDQCGLNAIIDGEWKKLPPKYNLQSLFFGEGKEQFLQVFEGNEMQEALNQPSIVHYTGYFKPWNYGVQHPYRKTYWDYRNRTPFKSYLSDDFTVRRMLAHCIPPAVKKWVSK